MMFSWKEAQEGEQVYWQNKCRSPIGVMYEMAEHSGLAYALTHILDRTPYSVLDVGVGPMGIGLLWLYPASSLKIGVDTLPRMEVQTGNIYVDELVRRIRDESLFIRAQGENLPFLSESFDLVVCNNVIDHSISPRKILDELCRVTKQKGHLGIGVDTNSLLGYALRWVDRRLRPHFNPYRLHPHDLIIGVINRCLRARGFCILDHNEASRWGALIGRRRMQWWVAKKFLG